MKNLKKWQKVCIALCGVGFVFSAMLLVPNVQNSVMDFVERIRHHQLDSQMWTGRLISLGAGLCAAFIVFAMTIFFTSSADHTNSITKFQKIHENYFFTKIFKNPFVGIPFLYFGLLILGLFLVCFAYTLPTKPMQENVKRSAPYFEFTIEGGRGHLAAMDSEESKTDDVTDAHMLIISAQKNRANPIISAMLNEFPAIHGEYSNKVLLEVYGKKNSNYDIQSYGRYWHGYTILLKPLLLLTSYGNIRHLMMYCQIILIVLIILFFALKNQKKHILPFVGTWLFFNPVALCLSMQYNTTFILLLLEILVILSFDKKYSLYGNLWIYHFFTVGCFTSYFDFLTYPSVTFGIPIVLLLSSYGNEKFKDNLIVLIKCGLAWTLGYILMWTGKWFVGSLISGTDILSDAKAAIINRTISPNNHESFSYFDVVIRNLKTGYNLFIAIIISVAISISNFCKEKRLCKKTYILFIAALIPFVWYFVTKGHSFGHFWFTYRNLGISVYAFLLLAVSMTNEQNEISAK